MLENYEEETRLLPTVSPRHKDRPNRVISLYAPRTTGPSANEFCLSLLNHAVGKRLIFTSG